MERADVVMIHHIAGGIPGSKMSVAQVLSVAFCLIDRHKF
jgi:hypothetical protein